MTCKPRLFPPDAAKLRAGFDCGIIASSSIGHFSEPRWEAEGWVKRKAGTLRRVEKVGDSFRVELQEPAGTRGLDVDRIVIATGPESDVQRLQCPLWQQLVAESVVEPDPLRLGILTDERGAVMQRGAVAPGLWALGSLLRPQFFESTAVPDLAKRAVALSVCLLASAESADSADSADNP